MTEHLRQLEYGRYAISDKLSNYELGRNRKTEMATNNTTPNLTIMIPNCNNMAQQKP